MRRGEQLMRRAAGRTVRPLVYRAIDTAFPQGLRRRIDGEVIRLGMHASRSYPSTYEPQKARFLRHHCRPGTTAIDVGAHFGVFAVIMARAVGPSGRVIAFEPSPDSRVILAATLAANECTETVTVRSEAVSEKAGDQQLFVSDGVGDMGNSLIPHGARSVTVRTLDLDSLNLTQPLSCIKIDAEGSEVDILRGALKTLTGQRPALTVEIHPWGLRRHGQTPEDVWSALREVGYAVFREERRLDKHEFISQPDYFEIQALHESSIP